VLTLSLFLIIRVFLVQFTVFLFSYICVAMALTILLIHNRYLQRGGEDTVFEAEHRLLQEAGYAVYTIEFFNKSTGSIWDVFLTPIRAIFNKQSYTIVQQAIRKYNPDIIHIHNLFFTASPSILFAAYHNHTPIIMTLHNYRLVCPSGILWHNNQVYTKNLSKIFPISAIFKKLYRNSSIQTAALICITGFHKVLRTWQNKITKYICLSEFQKQLMVSSSLGATASQYTVIPNFVFAPPILTKPEGSHTNTYFVFVGRLSPEKGIDLLLRAFCDNKHTLHIIGDGPLQPLVKQVASQYSNIIYKGHLSAEHVMQQIQQACALVFTSTWHETMGMTILEAFSLGTPVIASNLGAPGDIVKPDYNGLLFDVNSPDSLQTAITSMLNAQCRATCSDGAYQSYKEHFTAASHLQQLQKAYSQTIFEYAQKHTTLTLESA
jgi:glycosyltransferase involved in cell wall biosynthesis